MRRFTRSLAVATLAVMLGAAFSAQADYWDWVGKGAGETSFFDDKGCWFQSGSNTDLAKNNHNFSTARNPFTQGWDYRVTFRTTTSLTGSVNIDYAGRPLVFAAQNDGNGVSSTAQLNINNGAELQIESGTYRFSYFQMGNKNAGTLTMNGGALKGTSSYSRIGVGANGTGTVTIGTGASYDNLESSNGNFTIGQDSGASGVLNVAGGTVTIWNTVLLCYNAGSKEAAVNVTDGGVLTVGALQQTNPGTNGGTLTLNGGTLKAYASNASFLLAHAALHVYAGAAGATFDSSGCAVTIGEDIDDVSGEAGKVTFAGGGTVTFTGAANWTGVTTVEAGTTLALTAAAKAAVAAHGIVVAIPSTGAPDGATVFEITDGGSAFTQAEVDAIVLSGNDGNRYALVLAENGAKVVVSDTLAGEYVWNGGSAGASWTAAGKWTKNGTAGNWYDSTAAVFANANDSATVDSAVAAASVTFGADGAILAGGGTLSVAGEITVSNGVTASVAAPVAGQLTKSGPGTLLIGTSRTADQTTVDEGTLVFSGSGVLAEWSKIVLGADAAKTAVLKFENGATLASSVANLYVGGIAGGTTELYKDGGDWDVTWNVVFSEAKNATTRFYHCGGTLRMDRYIRLGYNAESDSGETYFEISGGTVTNTASSGGGYMDIGSMGRPGFRSVMAVKTGGTYGSAGSIVVGGNASGTLDIAGGTVFAADGDLILCYGADNEVGEDCAINISNGGMLITRVVRHGQSASVYGKANSTLTFNDGTLKASADGTLIAAHAKLDVVVATGGGVIDAGGRSVVIGEALAGPGGMAYKGGGTVTLSVAPAYSGKTTVEVGTTLVVPAAISGANLVFSAPQGVASGLYKVIAVTGGGAFADDVLSTATLPAGNLRFFMNDQKTEIWCVCANADDHVWIGGASGSLNDGAKWFPAEVPASGTAVIGSATDAMLENPCGSAFAATRIKFPANTAPVTISGVAMSGIASVANSSTSQIEFENAVRFSGDVDVLQSPGAIKFTGGAVGEKLARATDIHGTYTLTISGDYVEIGGTTVKSDGVYLLPNGTFYKHNGDFHVDAGGRAEVFNAKIGRGTDARLLGTLDGEFKVAGEFSVAGDNKDVTVTHYTVHDDGAGARFIVNSIRPDRAGCIVPLGNGKTVIGAGGVLRGNGYVRVANTGSHEIGSCADWTMGADYPGNTTTASFAFFKHNSTGQSTLTFDTTDHYDATIARTITSEASIGAANAASAEKFNVNVKGIGSFVFANTSQGYIFAGGLTVQDSATAKVKPGCCPGKGPVALVNRATLEVAESGMVTLNGDLAIAEGAALAFNFTDGATAPVLGIVEGGAMTSGGAVNVKLTAAADVEPRGEYVLTSGLDFTGKTVNLVDPPDWVGRVDVVNGNLVLTVKQDGTVIFLR